MKYCVFSVYFILFFKKGTRFSRRKLTFAARTESRHCPPDGKDREVMIEMKKRDLASALAQHHDERVAKLDDFARVENPDNARHLRCRKDEIIQNITTTTKNNAASNRRGRSKKREVKKTTKHQQQNTYAKALARVVDRVAKQRVLVLEERLIDGLERHVERQRDEKQIVNDLNRLDNQVRHRREPAANVFVVSTATKNSRAQQDTGKTYGYINTRPRATTTTYAMQSVHTSNGFMSGNFNECG